MMSVVGLQEIAAAWHRARDTITAGKGQSYRGEVGCSATGETGENG